MCTDIAADSAGTLNCKMCVHVLSTWQCIVRKTVCTGMAVLRADERSNGTHKNKLKSSFPCTCDRITAVRMLNCLTQKLKICIFVPSSLHVCFFPVT